MTGSGDGFTVAGIPMVISSALPLHPSDGEVARRLVRHGMAGILDWLGQDVGPAPDTLTHAYSTGGRMIVSAEMHDRLLRPLDDFISTGPPP